MSDPSTTEALPTTVYEVFSIHGETAQRQYIATYSNRAAAEARCVALIANDVHQLFSYGVTRRTVLDN